METASVSQVIQLFNRLTKLEQLEIADQISKQTFEERWKLTDGLLPDAGFSDDDIMKEVSAVRYGNKKV